MKLIGKDICTQKITTTLSEFHSSMTNKAANLSGKVWRVIHKNRIGPNTNTLKSFGKHSIQHKCETNQRTYEIANLFNTGPNFFKK